MYDRKYRNANGSDRVQLQDSGFFWKERNEMSQ